MSKKNSYYFTLPFFILSFLGFLDTVYLTITHYKNVIPPCSIAHGCEKVLTSQFSTIAGIPIQIPGIIFYISLIILLLLFLQTRNRLFFYLLTGIVISGLIVSIALFSLQAFVIHAFCQYCLASEVIILLLFILLLFSFRAKSTNSHPLAGKDL
jgi:uncharacterized membrane protein